jgi:uncharacterized protein (DUF1778 family)
MAADDPTETLTIRLPKGLKDLVDQAARFRATTVTTLVRHALQEALHPAGRTYEQPGFSKKFDEFLDKVDKANSKRIILLVADEDTGRRYFVSGVLLSDYRNDSLVAIGGPQNTWIVPRRDVVAWYEGPMQRELVAALLRQGWAERSAA